MGDIMKSAENLVPRIEVAGPFLVCGEGAAFALGDFEKISLLWKNFFKSADKIKSLNGEFTLGVCLGSHPLIPQTSDQAMIYIAGLPVSKLVDIPDGMVSCEVPRSMYAIFTHKGSLDKLLETIKFIWQKWIPENSAKYRHNGGPEFELYDSRFDPVSRAGEVDIYIPVIAQPNKQPLV